MTTHLIIVTFGSPQIYISQARRTQDLWQGSRILSYLASKGLEYITREQAKHAKIIYPLVSVEPPINIPNRLVIGWDGDLSGAQTCAKAIADAINDSWLHLSNQTMKYFIGDNRWGNVETLWKSQAKAWLSCYWIVVPCTANTYGENMGQANRAMDARKLLRNFSPIMERGRKCSITGEQEALKEEGTSYTEFWKARRKEQRNRALIGKHECLSAISTIKRFAHEEHVGIAELAFGDRRFPSTSSIAAASFRHDVIQAMPHNPDLRQAVSNFIKALLVFFERERDLFFMRDGKLNPEYFGKIASLPGQDDPVIERFRSFDGDFLFEDTLISKTIEEYSRREAGEIRETDVKCAREALEHLRKTAEAAGILPPMPYLVILSMDGDNMGKTLSALHDETQHTTFSQALAEYARDDVYRIVEKTALGRVVYAGGDDVLALLPVRDALKIADDLRLNFTSRIQKKVPQQTIHASTGLAYVHHTHNLQDAVNAAHEAQKRAKKGFGRNAVVVSLLRRSGEPREMGRKWDTNTGDMQTHVSALVEAFNSGLARNLPYDMVRFIYSMAGESIPEEARRAELTRIIKRRLPQMDKDVKSQRAIELFDHITALTDMPVHELKTRWENALGWVELARFIATSEQET